MRYFILLFSITILSVALTACIGQNPTTLETKSSFTDLPSEIQENEIEIRISSDQAVYSLPIKKMHLVIENTGSTAVGFGGAVYLEKLEEEIWYEIPYKNITFTDGEAGVAPGESYLIEVPIDMIHYELQKGTYRILKEFYIDSRPKTFAAEFEIE